MYRVNGINTSKQHSALCVSARKIIQSALWELLAKAVIIDVTKRIDPEELELAIAALSAGKLIVAPTDTLYGILGDAFSKQVVDRIFAIKKRHSAAPLPLICADIEQAKKVVQLRSHALKLAENFWPGPLTLALPAQPGIPPHLVADDGTVAVRVPAHELCRKLAEGLGRPLTATSANLSGMPAARRIEDIGPEVLAAMDRVFDEGLLPQVKPSTILKVLNDEVVMVREGVIHSNEIAQILGEAVIESRR